MTAQRRRSGPPPQRAAYVTTENSTHFTAYRPQDGYAAPDLDDRLDAEVVEAARARGFRLATRCTRCGQWVVAPKSVAAHMGPVCRAKAAEAVANV